MKKEKPRKPGRKSLPEHLKTKGETLYVPRPVVEEVRKIIDEYYQKEKL